MKRRVVTWVITTITGAIVAKIVDGFYERNTDSEVPVEGAPK